MRQVARKSSRKILITVAAASGVFAVTGGYAHADAGADGSARKSPGIASGNTIQVPVHIPINVCGNTVNVVGLLNPAFGNSCANVSGKHGGHNSEGGSGAHGASSDSPGIASGNTVQVPIDVPVNVCGNSVSVVGALNPAFGNECANVSHGKPGKPGHPHKPEHPENPNVPDDRDRPERPDEQVESDTETRPDKPSDPDRRDNPGTPGTPEPRGQVKGVHEQRAQTVTASEGEEQLAETGTDVLGFALPASAALLLGGGLLYRRSRAASRP
jgi:hypothetical protein